MPYANPSTPAPVNPTAASHLLGTIIVGLCLVIGCDSSPESEPIAPSSAKTPAAKRQDNERLKHLLNVGGKGERRNQPKILPAFENVAESSGVRFKRFNDEVPKRYFLPEIMGGGVAWIDFDRDGRFDLYAMNGCKLWDPDPAQTVHRNRLFRNVDGRRFSEVAELAGTADNRFGQGCAVGDVNGDGFADLYLTNYGRNVLLINNGDGTFADETETAGVGDASWGTSTVILDADDDGHADIYVVNYLGVTRENHQVCTYNGVPGYCGPGQWKTGVEDVLYFNRGDGTFRVAGKPESVDVRHAKGLAVAVCDFNGDARPEIYIANDMAPNTLLVRNNSKQSSRGALYRNIAEGAGCAFSGDGYNEASMGIACSDFDGDGRVDIFITHFYQHKNTLYRNLGALRFEDASRRSRLAATSFETLGFGTAAFDADWDGDDDLFIANGHVLGPAHSPFQMKQQLLTNDGHGVFHDHSARIGEYFKRPCVGRGAAAGDYDNDGRVDVAVNHLDLPLALLRNRTTSPHHFIGFELIAGNRIHPAGGRLIVQAGKRKRIVPIVGGGSYLSSGDPRLVVGLGTARGPVRVSVVWPGGNTEDLGELTPNRYWVVREGRGAIPSATATPQKRNPNSGSSDRQ